MTIKTGARTAPKLSTFEVDKAGLAKLLERRGKEWVVAELFQNAVDEDVTRVDMQLGRPEGGLSLLVVEDDNPTGFADIAHAYTLFADSAKKTDVTKRGRFNLGEKLVIALCDRALISTTKALIEFGPDGRSMEAPIRKRGSRFEGYVPMTDAEYERACAFAKTLIVPSGVLVTFNGEVMEPREPVCEFESSLRTERADDEGVLRPTTRKTVVRVYRVRPGEVAHLYELGIPVVPTGDTYHVCVEQKVPLNTDRDNVPPAFLRDVRAGVLNATYALLTREEASEGWVNDGLADKTVTHEAVHGVVTARFGDRAVISDPTDREGTNIAVTKGYVVVPGSAFPRGAWENVKGAGALLPAGQVTPSPKPYSEQGDGPVQFLEYAYAPQAVRDVVDLTVDLARVVLGAEITVRIANDPQWGFLATYGPRQKGRAGEFTYNIGALGFALFDLDTDRKVARWLELVILEFAHHLASNHLSEAFYDACCKYGAAMARALAFDAGLRDRVYGRLAVTA
jgi:hypothetical protein